MKDNPPETALVGKTTIEMKTPIETTIERLGLTPRQVEDALSWYGRDGFLAFLELYGHYVALKRKIGNHA